MSTQSRPTGPENEVNDDSKSTLENLSDSSKNNDEHTLPPTASKPSLVRVFGMFTQEMPMFILSLMLLVWGESTTLIIPLILSNAYDFLVGDNTPEDERMNEISYLMKITLIVTAAGMLAQFLRASILGIIGERVVARLRYQLYNAILKQDIAFFDKHKSEEIISWLGRDTSLLQQAISTSLAECVVGVSKPLVSVGLMFWISSKLTGVAIGSMVLISLVAIPIGDHLGKLSNDYHILLGEAQAYSSEALGKIRTVQAFNAETKELHRFGRKVGYPDNYPLWWPTLRHETSIYRVGYFKAWTVACFYAFIFGAGFSCLYVTLWYGFSLVNTGEITLGELTAFQSYVFTIVYGLGVTSSHVTNIFEGISASGRIFYVIDRVPAILKSATNAEIAKPTKPDAIKGRIKFNDVSFAYPSHPDIPVLNEFSLSIAANTTMALVGSSGAGKSTVLAILQRFYDVQSGSITIDGHNIENLDLKWLRRNIGYVEQAPQFFGLTVRENLLYGVDREVSQEELENACRDAHAHGFIMDLADQYNTLVGERGVNLSDGQKQRMAIARALLANCRILLIDEAPLDSESEYLGQDAIDRAATGRTVIIVARRLSTLQKADQIAVINDHRVVDVGTHASLLHTSPDYKHYVIQESTIFSDVSFPVTLAASASVEMNAD